MIVFFDGVCNLCNHAVQFIIKRDSKNVFKFASLQSDFAKQKLKDKIDTEKLDSIVLLDGDKLFVKSSAALKISKMLSGLWPLLYIFILLPKPIRDGVYLLIAKYRYTIFGKKDACMIPDSSVKQKFLDNDL